MVNKVSDLFMNFFKAKESASTQVPGMSGLELTARQKRAMEDAANELRGLAEQIIGTSKQINELNKVINTSKNIQEVNNAKARRQTLNNDLTNKYDAMDAKQRDMERRHGISRDVMESWNDALLALEEDQSKYFSNATITFESLDDFFKNGVGEVSKIAKELGGVTALFGYAFDQIVALNDELIKFNRKMSQSISAQSIGFTNMGNGGLSLSNIGSVNAISAENGIGVSEFLDSFQAFSKGNIVGLSQKIDESSTALTNYGLTAAKISKQFNVDAGILGGLTSNLLYNYGMKVEDINKTLKEGTEIAYANGVAINVFFKNLEEASNLSGKLYIANGTAGLEKMATLASKLNVSISDMAGFASKFSEYNSLYQRQNLAAALGLWEVSKNTAKMWADIRIGKTADAFKEFITSAAKDLQRNNYIDDKGQIRTAGIQSLEAVGASQEEIKAITNLARAQNETGAKFEELTGQMEANLWTQMKIDDFQRRNLTITERFGQIWDKVKAIVIDPLASILGPVLDVALTAISTALDVLLFVLKPVIWGFQAIGWVLDKVATAFGWISTAINKFFGLFDDEGNAFIQVLRWMADAVGLATAAIISYTAVTKLASMVQGAGGIGNLIRGTLTEAVDEAGVSSFSRVGGLLGEGGLMSRIPGVGRMLVGDGVSSGIASAGRGIAGFGGEVASNAGGLLARTGGFLNGGTLLGGLARGSLIGTAGSFVSNLLGNAVGGKAGESVSTIGSYASWGAGLGLMAGPIGAGIGALIGGAVGVVQSSWGDIKKVWSDGQTGLGGFFKHIGGTFMAIGNTIGDMFKGIYNWAQDLFKKDDSEKDRLLADKIHDNSLLKINQIIQQREDPTMQAPEKAQEKHLQQNFHFKVTNDWSGAASARITPSTGGKGGF